MNKQLLFSFGLENLKPLAADSLTEGKQANEGIRLAAKAQKELDRKRFFTADGPDIFADGKPMRPNERSKVQCVTIGTKPQKEPELLTAKYAKHAKENWEVLAAKMRRKRKVRTADGEIDFLNRESS
jgi:hypothetical protein